MWVEQLLEWYQKEKRDLPWRENTDPYRVWISEIMLQQTRVEAVIGYYQNWMCRFPSIEELAHAQEIEVLKCWEGLGYYNRARNLQKCAQICVEQNHGCLPSTYHELIQLPGIGMYTAASISSICFHQPHSAVDGNVLRVYSRLMLYQEDISKQKTKEFVKRELDQVLPQNAGDFNQALMELGACICIGNGAARCNICPISTYCKAYQEGKVYDYPVKSKKKARRIEERMVLLLRHENRYYIQKRPDHGLLAGLYEFMNVEKESDWQKKLASYVIKIESLEYYKHIFSHVEWRIEIMQVEVHKPFDGLWVTKDQLLQYPIASAYEPCIKYLE